MTKVTSERNGQLVKDTNTEKYINMLLAKYNLEMWVTRFIMEHDETVSKMAALSLGGVLCGEYTPRTKEIRILLPSIEFMATYKFNGQFMEYTQFVIYHEMGHSDQHKKLGDKMYLLSENECEAYANGFAVQGLGGNYRKYVK